MAVENRDFADSTSVYWIDMKQPHGGKRELIRKPAAEKGSSAPEVLDPIEKSEAPNFQETMAVFGKAISKARESANTQDKYGLYQLQVLTSMEGVFREKVFDVNVIDTVHSIFKAHRAINKFGENKGGVILQHINTYYDSVLDKSEASKKVEAHGNIMLELAEALGMPLSDPGLISAEARKTKQWLAVIPKETMSKEALAEYERTQSMQERSAKRGERIDAIINGLLPRMLEAVPTMVISKNDFKDGKSHPEMNEKLQQFAALVVQRINRQLKAKFTDISRADKMSMTDQEAYIQLQKDRGHWDDDNAERWDELSDEGKAGVLKSNRTEILRIKDDPARRQVFQNEYIDKLATLDAALAKLAESATGPSERMERLDLLREDRVRVALAHVKAFFKHTYIADELTPNEKERTASFMKDGGNFVKTFGTYVGATFPKTLKGIEGAQKYEQKKRSENAGLSLDAATEELAPAEDRLEAERLRNLAITYRADLARFNSRYIAPIQFMVDHPNHPYLSPDFLVILKGLIPILHKDRERMRTGALAHITEAENGPQDAHIRSNLYTARLTLQGAMIGSINLDTRARVLIDKIESSGISAADSKLGVPPKSQSSLEEAFDILVAKDGKLTRAYDTTIHGLMLELADRVEDLRRAGISADDMKHLRLSLEGLERNVARDYACEETLQKVRFRTAEAQLRTDAPPDRLGELSAEHSLRTTELLSNRTRALSTCVELRKTIDQLAVGLKKKEQKTLIAPPSATVQSTAASVLDSFYLAREKNGVQHELKVAQEALAAMKAEAAQNSEAFQRLQAEAHVTNESLLDHKEVLGGMTEVVKSTITMLESALAQGHEDPEVLSKDIEGILAKLRRINEITD